MTETAVVMIDQQIVIITATDSTMSEKDFDSSNRLQKQITCTVCFRFLLIGQNYKYFQINIFH